MLDKILGLIAGIIIVGGFVAIHTDIDIFGGRDVKPVSSSAPAYDVAGFNRLLDDTMQWVYIPEFIDEEVAYVE